MTEANEHARRLVLIHDILPSVSNPAVPEYILGVSQEIKTSQTDPYYEDIILKASMCSDVSMGPKYGL